MKREEVWHPNEVNVGNTTFKVGDIFFFERSARKEPLLQHVGFSLDDFEKGGVIRGFAKQHYIHDGPGPMWVDCECECHNQESIIDEPCEKCNTEKCDKGCVVIIEAITPTSLTTLAGGSTKHNIHLNRIVNHIRKNM